MDKIQQILDHIDSFSVITRDSRRVKKGAVFFALKGVNTDGRQYVADAVSRGAEYIVSDMPIEGVANVLVVADVAEAYKRALYAKHKVDPSDFFSIAVTGTNGKTTTTFLIKHILEKTGAKVVLFSTIGYEFGAKKTPAPTTTPDAETFLESIGNAKKAGFDTIAMEVSSHSLDQDRLLGFSFDVGVFTNLSQDHLDYHRTMENYYAAKKRLFERYLKADGSAVVNAAGGYGQQLARDIADMNPFTIGMGETKDFYTFKKVHPVKKGTRFVFCAREDCHLVETGLIGEYNVENISCALAACDRSGVELRDAIAAVKVFTPPEGRLQRFSAKGIDAYVDYAHTPDAIEKAINALKRSKKYKRVIIVFGAGGNRDKGKRPLMGRIASQYADHVILTSDNPRFEEPQAIINDILSGVGDKNKVSLEPDRSTAIWLGISMAKRGDAVLIAGKGHENYQEVMGERRPFSDAKAVEECLSKI